MAHNLKWDDLQIVLAVAEHRSLSGAARTIGVNHATILRRVQALERQIGVTLFDRPPGGYRLRPEAQDLLSSLHSIAQSVGRVERGLAAARLGTGGSLRLTTTDSIANLLLPRHLLRLRDTRPDLEIEVVVANQSLDMARPEAEITIRPTPSLPTAMRGQSAGSMAFAVYGSPEYLAQHSGIEPAAHRWIGVAPPLTRSPVGSWQERRLPIQPLVRADSFLVMARLVAEGAGLAMIPTFVAREAPGLVPASAFPERETTTVWVASHGELAAVPQVSALIDFFTKAMASERARLA